MVDFDVGAAGAFDDAQPQAFSPDVVGLAADHLALRLTRRVLELLPLLLDPGQALNDREPYPVIGEPSRCRHPDPAFRWVDADVQVLDVPVDDLDVDPADGQGGLSGTHPMP